MEGYLVFDTYRGRMVNVYHAKNREEALEAKENLKALHKHYDYKRAGGFGPVIILHLGTVPIWKEGFENGEGAKTIQESTARLI